MPFVFTNGFHTQVREYITVRAIDSIDSEPPMLETALFIAQEAICEYSHSDPGMPYTTLTEDMQWARLCAMHHKTIMDLRKEFWPEWPVNPLETCADALSRQLVEHSFSMIRWNTVADHYLKRTLEEIALLAPSSVMPIETHAGPEDAPPEPAMSFWV